MFDLIDSASLSKIGLVQAQLWGPIGAVTLESLKENARRLGCQYFSFRDPLRPGLMWVEDLVSGARTPWRGYEAARLVERLMPGLVNSWETLTTDPVDWEMVYPPIETPPLQYATALEWLVQKFPNAVVAWVELSLTYENELRSIYATPILYEQCKKDSYAWRIIGEVLGVFEPSESIEVVPKNADRDLKPSRYKKASELI